MAASRAHADAAAQHTREGARLSKLASKAPKALQGRLRTAAGKQAQIAAEHRSLAKYHSTAAPTLEELGIKHDLSDKAKRGVERAVQRGGFGAYLREHPITEVREHGATTTGPAGERQAANGVYSHPKSLGGAALVSLKAEAGVKVAFDKAQAKWAKQGGPAKLGSDKLFSLSTLAKTVEGMRERTMVHELSHHIHLDKRNPLAPKLDKAIESAYNARVDANKSVKPGAWTPSVYSRGNHKEWFAEVHAAYVFHPKALERNDPEAYRLIQRVRRARGM